MSVILVDKIPQNCGECPLSWPDNYFSGNPPLQCNFVYAPMGLDESKRHEACPLKSVDKLLEEIKNTKALRCKDNLGNVFVFEEDLYKIIKEYCGMEEEKVEKGAT